METAQNKDRAHQRMDCFSTSGAPGHRHDDLSHADLQVLTTDAPRDRKHLPSDAILDKAREHLAEVEAMKKHVAGQSAPLTRQEDGSWTTTSTNVDPAAVSHVVLDIPVKAVRD